MKKQRVYTTRRQSRKLIELGINTLTADSYDGVPLWSVPALCSLAPRLREGRDSFDLYKCTESRHMWIVRYDQTPHLHETYGTMIDAVFEMVCWMLENGIIKK